MRGSNHFSLRGGLISCSVTGFGKFLTISLNNPSISVKETIAFVKENNSHIKIKPDESEIEPKIIKRIPL